MRRRDPYWTNTGIHIRWFTVRWSSILFVIAAVAGVAAVGSALRKDADTVAPLRASDGVHFLFLDGTVEVRKAGESAWVDATIDMEIGEQDTIRTVGNSEARLQLLHGTVYVMRPRSLLVIESAREESNKSGVLVESGVVDVTTPPQTPPGSQTGIATREVRATVNDDSDASMRFEPTSGRSEVEVRRGGVDLDVRGKPETVREGEGVEVRPGRGAIKFPLMRAPVLVSPLEHEVLAADEPARFRWQPVEGARRYRVVLDRSPEFPDPLFDSTVSGGAVLHPRLTPGTYFWKVSAIGYDNEPSDPRVARFVVRRRSRARAPSLTIAVASVTIDGLVTLTGSTDADCAVTILYRGDDRAASVDSDGSFQHRFLLRGSRPHAVTVRSRARRNGAVTEKKTLVDYGPP